MSAPDSTPILAAAREFCAGQGMELLDLLETLEEHLPEISPPSCRVSQCGSCGRRSAVPSGAALRQHREDHGFSQGDVAREANVAKQHISHIESDRRDPSAAIVKAYETLAIRAVERAGRAAS